MAFEIKYIYQLVDNISPKVQKIKRNIDASARGVKAAAAKMGRAFEVAGRKLDKFGKKARDVGKGLFLKTTLPLGLLARSFVNSASDYQESLNKVDVAFGNSAEQVKKFATAAGQKFGIDRGSALDMAAMFGDMGTGMGLAQNKAAGMATSLVGLAGDLASFKNIGVDQAQTALAGIFTGETESLKRLGIVMTETNLQQFALSKGIKTKVKNMQQAEKVLLRYNFIVAKSKNSIGDFARTSEGYANQQRILASRWKDLSIILGVTLLPYATKLVNKLIQLVEWFTNLSPRVQKIILIVSGLVAILSPLLIMIGMVSSGIAALVPIFMMVGKAALFFVKGIRAITVAMAANPVGAFIMALIAIIYYWDEIVAIAQKAIDFFKQITFDDLITAAKAILEVFTKIFDKIKSFTTGIGKAILPDSWFGDDSASPINKASTNKINQNQTMLKAGGELNVNLNGFPNGSNANMTPVNNSFMDYNTGFNRVYQGS